MGHSQGNTSIYSLLELSDKTILTYGGNLTMKHYKFIINEKKLEEIQEYIIEIIAHIYVE